MDKAEVVKLRDTLKAGMNLPVQVFLDNAYSFVDESNIAQFTIWDDNNGVLFVFRLPDTEWSDDANDNRGQNVSVYACDYDQIQGIAVSPLPLEHLDKVLDKISEIRPISDDFRTHIITVYSKLLKERNPDPTREFYNKIHGSHLDTRDDYFAGKLTPDKGRNYPPEYDVYTKTSKPE